MKMFFWMSMSEAGAVLTASVEKERYTVSV
jgi:hypothetical protein